MLERFYDGPFTAPIPTGAAAPAPDLVAEIAVLPQVLATPEPQVPALRDWSYRWNESLAEWGGRFSHWVDWTDADTALVASALNPQVEQLVDGLIERWAWIWPDVAAQVLPAAEPRFVSTLTELCARDPRYRNKRDAFGRNWLDTALHEGLFEHFRRRRQWPAPTAHSCRICGRIFPPETLSHWMRQYGSTRYCSSCCCRARGGFRGGSPEMLRAAIRAATNALGFIPAQAISATADLNGLEDQSRDRAFGAMVCLPDPDDAAVTLGITGRAGRWLAILQASGVVGDAWRPSKGTMCFARDGHACRSLGERSLDDFMSSRGLRHEPEPYWPVHAALNPGGMLRADWRLEDGTLVEYAGLMETPSYAERIAMKQRLAMETGHRLLIIAPPDLARLVDVFAPWLPSRR